MLPVLPVVGHSPIRKQRNVRTCLCVSLLRPSILFPLPPSIPHSLRSAASAAIHHMCLTHCTSTGMSLVMPGRLMRVAERIECAACFLEAGGRLGGLQMHMYIYMYYVFTSTRWVGADARRSNSCLAHLVHASSAG
eukprot:GHVU01226217.1.p2 GENE.GHVU01226217.1~~GHVU01226217.1.p2  ORF type:complete len:136 (+),score=2.75 GHVU01226217.1:144-551(+)